MGVCVCVFVVIRCYSKTPTTASRAAATVVTVTFSMLFALQ